MKEQYGTIELTNPTTARPEHANVTETQGNELKNYFMKMIEALKGEMKIPLKKSKKRQTKKMEEINKSLRESQEKTNR